MIGNISMKNKNSNIGFTLVETLIAVAIFVVVVVSVASFQVSVYSNQRVVSSSLQTAQDAQNILKTIVTELRSAAPAANGTYAIAAAGTSSISFFSDINNDGKTDKIGYTYSLTTIYKSVISPTGSPPVYLGANQSTTTLMTNVRNATSTPIFQYFDQNYTGTSSPMTLPINIAAVRLIKVNITLDTDPKLSPTPRTYTIQIGLRNLKTNL